MLGWLKEKMHKKDYNDFEDIRSNVLGSDFLRNPEPDFPRRNNLEPTALEDPRRFSEPAGRFEEPTGFSTIDTRFSESPERGRLGREKEYDIIDRLNLIESQLSAIRSQTETINERLKNLERLVSGRRY